MSSKLNEVNNNIDLVYLKHKLTTKKAMKRNLKNQVKVLTNKLVRERTRLKFKELFKSQG